MKTTDKQLREDPWVLEVQQWLNATYKDVDGFGSVPEDGNTGWATIYGLIRAVQHELGITDLVDNFGAATSALWDQKVMPNLINQYESPIVKLIDGAFRCKGMGNGKFDSVYTLENDDTIKGLKTDAGFENPTSTLDSMWAKSLFDMSAFVLVPGGDARTREMQQTLNRKYSQLTGILPCDGIYQRATNTALIYGIQVEIGLSEVANGNFGPATQGAYGILAENHQIEVYNDLVLLIQYALYQNLINVRPSGVPFSGALDTETTESLSLFQLFLHLTDVTDGYPDLTTAMSLMLSSGDPNRSFNAVDTSEQLTLTQITTLQEAGIQYVGRYLTGTVGNDFIPKYLTVTEAKNIVNAGMAIIPIYQDNNPVVSYYTYDQGVSDANTAFAAADSLGFDKGTVIYFAVDVDALDTDITTNIMPYFNALHDSATRNGIRFNVGVYGTRNVCMRVSEAGYTVSSYVSNMSTGWSGNLGFSQPTDWAFDQFSEPSGGIGSGDGLVMIDKLNVSGIDPGVTAVSAVEPAIGVLKNLGLKLIDEAINNEQFELGVEMPIFSVGPVTLTQTLAGTVQSVDANDNLIKFSVINGKIDPAFVSEVSDMLGSGIAGKLEANMEGLTAAIEDGDAELSGGYEDGKISISLAINMQKVTVEGAEITASVKYEIEIDLNKIGNFYKELFSRMFVELLIAAGIYLLIVLAPILGGILATGAAGASAAGVIALVITAITGLNDSEN
ncbi:MAG: DUF1906 domain-containing protein [Lactobacillus sp.]|nr:DUF1906 domain-containing protein [Lactobacillus sp.]